MWTQIACNPWVNMMFSKTDDKSQDINRSTGDCALEKTLTLEIELNELSKGVLYYVLQRIITVLSLF